VVPAAQNPPARGATEDDSKLIQMAGSLAWLCP
jgi:hypothetical protein